jgi:hypothetical protein
MGEYTIDIRQLLQRGYKLALNSYPIWAEEYRPFLNQKIIDHFMFREIGQETPDRFNFFLQRKMNEIMPYYNKLYESELIQFDPMATEFFKEGTESRHNRDYESQANNNSKRGETVGDVFSKNEDTAHDQTFGQVSGENVKGSYSKQGDKTVDTTSEKTEDLKQDKTSQKNENFTQDKTRNDLTTNNLHTKTISDGTSDGTASKTGTNNTVFSDIPQAGVETTTVTSPDGTVTTTTKGYATTETNVSTSENAKTSDKTHSQTDTDNTGTVKTDITEKITNDNTTNYTENNRNDNTTNFSETEQTDWHENGSNTEASDYKNDETTNYKTNNKEDSERNITTNEKKSNVHKERSKTGENTSEIYTGKGRKGISPSELILKYRQTLLNVDMMIIEELETLFMGVY